MDFAPTEQPEGHPDGLPAEQPASEPAYVAAVQAVTAPTRRSRSLIAGAVLAGAIGLTAVAVGLASTGAPAAAPGSANAQGVLLGADTGTWTAPNGGTATAPGSDGMMGDPGGAGGVGPGAGFGAGGGFGMGGSRMGGIGPGGFGPGGRFGGRGMFSAISITAIDGTKLGLKTADGWTRTIDAAGATITRSGQTVDVSTLKVGDSIAFDQARQSDGSFKITTIVVVLPRAAGTVKSVTDSSATLTQRDGTDKVIQLTGSTTYKLAGAAATRADLTVGAQVEAEGTTATDGTFTATLVNIQPAVASGTVTSKTATTITVKTRDGSALTINVDAATTYQVAGKTVAALADVSVGSIVLAEGTRKADGTFSATVVRSFATGKGGFSPGPGFGPGVRGGRGMPSGPRMPGLQPSPTPAGTTN